MLKTLKGFVPKLRFLLVAIVSVTLLYSFMKDDVKKITDEAAKTAAAEKSRESARVSKEQFFWVTAEVPSCVKIPGGDSILASVGKEGKMRVIYPDGEVMRIGPKQRAPVRSFEAGKIICLILDDGEKEPIKMRLKT
jgi:hypothetical protein